MQSYAIKELNDHMGNEGKGPHCPKIISLVPSITELLFNLELQDQIIGVTKFCVHPKELTKSIPKIGGTKNFKFDVIDELTPDLIIGNKEENYKEGIELLQTKYSLLLTDIKSIPEAIEMIRDIGAITGRARRAQSIIDKINNGLESLHKREAKRVLYLIWRKPYMAVGGDTYINNVLETLGLKNVLKEVPRYPELSLEEINELKPDLILLSSEPFPFKEKHKRELERVSALSNIHLVDGEMFSWYGSRIIQALSYFNSLQF
ncbi:helical backbone metal receptor [Fulvivirga sediminis]|uniref:ABC transporter substrate-binding protein n=1 Tax=Fulvivirga sediminis TaxID=2803949 RepID=A0A937F8H9_9BACT|nr:helical backbone metal receptor [Fulvivirga sediminis]MBL3656549.1 ABC transporter substrate-binding protein [Fulvivirga sediminis]